MSLKQAFEEIKKQDLKSVKKWLEENKNELHYNKEKEVWLIDGVEIVDELWYEQKTNLHPKVIIEDIEKIIEKDIMNNKEKRKNYAKIVLIDGNWDYEVYYDESYDNEYYTLIDKQLMGAKISEEIKSNIEVTDVLKENANECDDLWEMFDEEFIDDLLSEIDGHITNKLRNEIATYTLGELLGGW